MLQMLLAVLGLCYHPDLVRERVGGVWHFVCPDCGYSVPVLRKVK